MHPGQRRRRTLDRHPPTRVPHHVLIVSPSQLESPLCVRSPLRPRRPRRGLALAVSEAGHLGPCGTRQAPRRSRRASSTSTAERARPCAQNAPGVRTIDRLNLRCTKELFGLPSPVPTADPPPAPDGDGSIHQPLVVRTPQVPLCSPTLAPCSRSRGVTSGLVTSGVPAATSTNMSSESSEVRVGRSPSPRRGAGLSPWPRPLTAGRSDCVPAVLLNNSIEFRTPRPTVGLGLCLGFQGKCRSTA